MSARWISALATTALVCVGAPAALAQERATYTPAQAAAGRAAHGERCAERHRDDMKGSPTRW